MKCPSCGLVTFDDLPECPRCKASFALVRPLATASLDGSRHLLRDDRELRVKLRNRLHRARLDRRKQNENPLAAGPDPDAPDWFEPLPGDGNGSADVAVAAPTTTGGLGEETQRVHSDDLSPDDERGGTTTADADYEVAGAEPEMTDEEPEFDGEIPGFNDWREELRERLKRIRARREAEAARQADELEAGTESDEPAVAVDEPEVIAAEDPIDPEPVAGADPIDPEPVAGAELEADVAGTAVEEVAEPGPGTAGDLIAQIVDGDPSEAPDEPTAETSPDLDDAAVDDVDFTIETSAEAGVDIDLDAAAAEPIVEIDLDAADAEPVEEIDVDDAADAEPVGEIDVDEAADAEPVGEIDLDAGADPEPILEIDLDESAAAEPVAEVDVDEADADAEPAAEIDLDESAAAESDVEIDLDESADIEPDVEPDLEEAGEADLVELDESVAAKSGPEPDGTPVEETEAASDLPPVVMPDLYGAADTDESAFDEERITFEPEEEAEPLAGAITADEPVSSEAPEPELESDLPELDFDEAASASATPAPAFDVEAEEATAGAALEWDEEEIAASGPSTAGPLGERAAAALCDLLVLTAIGAALVGAASSGTGATFSQVLAAQAPWLALTWGIFAVGYSVFFVGSCGQTIGRMVMRLRVIGDEQFSVGFDRAAIRLLAWVVSALPLGAGLLPALRDPQRRALHDRLSRTRVVKA